MNYLFCMLLPSLIGMIVIEKLNGKESVKKQVTNYLLLVFFSNLLLMLSIALINKFDYNLILYISEHMTFALKYTFLSIVINLILAFLISYINKYFDISIEVKHGLQKNKFKSKTKRKIFNKTNK